MWNYTIFNALRILCLSGGGLILKKYCKHVPDQFIPAILVIIATVTTFVFFGYFNELTPWNMRLANGPICGLASVGLHQLIKQTWSYITIKKALKQNKRLKKVNIS